MSNSGNFTTSIGNESIKNNGFYEMEFCSEDTKFF